MLQNHDRRITEQLILHWNQLRKERLFPRIEEVSPEALKSVWQDCYVISLDESSNAGFHFKYLGDNIREFVAGNTVADKELSRRLWQSFRTIQETHKPVVEESELTLSENEVIKYRTILLPLGADEQQVDHVFGGIRFRIFEANETDNIHHLLVEPDPYAAELMGMESSKEKKAAPPPQTSQPDVNKGDISQFMRPSGDNAAAGAVSAPTASEPVMPAPQQANASPSSEPASGKSGFMSPAEYKKMLEQQQHAEPAAAGEEKPADSGLHHPPEEKAGNSSPPPPPPQPEAPAASTPDTKPTTAVPSPPPPPPPPASNNEPNES